MQSGDYALISTPKKLARDAEFMAMVVVNGVMIRNDENASNLGKAFENKTSGNMKEVEEEKGEVTSYLSPCTGQTEATTRTFRPAQTHADLMGKYAA